MRTLTIKKLKFLLLSNFTSICILFPVMSIIIWYFLIVLLLLFIASGVQNFNSVLYTFRGLLSNGEGDVPSCSYTRR